MTTAHEDDGDPATLHLVFECKNVDLAATRESLRDWASSLAKVPPSLVADLELAATELLTNAREAAPDPDSPVKLSAAVTDNRLTVTVRNIGGLFELPTPRLGATDERGRGLAIVRYLSDNLVVSQERDTVAVSARFDLTQAD